MTRVQFAPISSAVAGAAVATVLGAVALQSHESLAPLLGWLATITYLVISNVVLLNGLRQRKTTRIGAANVVTAVRSTLVALISGIVVASFVSPIPVGLLVALIVPALLLDAVDGWVARRTNSASELGARFDMEVDAFLLLALSAYVSQTLGVWVLAIGLMRYTFVAAGWIFPWLRRQLPFRYWRKVVTAVQGIALTVAAAGLLPGGDAVVVVIALALLVESFGRDVIWLRRTMPVVTPPPVADEVRQSR
ncbi:MAG TPA: CDP-alcohol phosphatidyltransferase family protein [Galbitalea sp.]